MCAAILAAAFGAVAAAIKLKPEAPTKPTAARKAGVQVVEARAEALNPVVEGYGRARPVRRVTIAAEVGGRVVRVAPGLDDGQPLAAGCLAVEIEAVDYEARVAGAAAQRDSAQASVDQLKVQTETLRRRLAVQQRILAVEQADLERVSRLEGTGVAMERELDAARRAVLRAEDTVADMAGRIAAAAPQLAAAEARVRETEAALTTAEANLKRTRIVAPFSGVVAAVTVEADQQVAPNQRLFELWDVSKVEIPVALPLEQAGLLAPDLCGVDGPEGCARCGSPWMRAGCSASGRGRSAGSSRWTATRRRSRRWSRWPTPG